jgi:hypothetical protein
VPGESKLGALLDFTRSVVRRAERSMVTANLAHDHPHALEAANRLSDLMRCSSGCSARPRSTSRDDFSRHVLLQICAFGSGAEGNRTGIIYLTQA